MYKLFACFIVCILGLVGCAPKQQPVVYFSNPVIRGDLADPSIVRVGETYYVTGTSSEWAPYYPMYTSTDLVNWKQVGHVFEQQPEWTLSSFWAPELFYHNNTMYCYYTARRKTDSVSYIGVATATHPLGPFTDHGLLVEFGTEAIDAFVYDDNGQLYISWKAYGLDDRPIELLASKLSADGLHLEGEPFSLLKDDERIGMEGQYQFKQGDYYYIVYSAHGCCGPNSDYDVYVARAKAYRGPYEKFEGNPILHGGGDFMSCGHGTATTTPDGRMYYFCHAYQSGDAFYLGRQSILQEMTVGDDGWVHFQGGALASVKHPMPFAGTVQDSLPPFEDNFKEPKLRNEWAWNYPYSDAAALCLRPSSPHYMYETQVINSHKGSAGLTMYGDDKNLLTWLLVDNKLILKTVQDGIETVLKEIPMEEDSVFLKVEVSNGCYCRCFWSKDGTTDEPATAERINCRALVRWDRVARPGLIYTGDKGKPTQFSSFKMTNL